MGRFFIFALCALLSTMAALRSVEAAGCRKVASSEKISINSGALKRLAKIGIDREAIFKSLRDVSIPETSGCWSGATGNFDGQIVSVGVLQWNYGQNSLQPVLRAFQNQFSTDKAYDLELARLMPHYGKLLFSKGCLARRITADCKEQILTHQSGSGRFEKSFQQELDSLFESDAMVQVQTDQFVKLLESVRDDLERLFPGRAITPRQVKWAIDTKVQQGKFPGNADVARVRNTWKELDKQRQVEKLRALVRWYEGLSNAPDQDGTSKVYAQNVKIWSNKISSTAISDEQADLLLLSFLKSRTAQGQAGRWQALTFQRRATIILGAGCVAGHCIDN